MIELLASAVFAFLPVPPKKIPPPCHTLTQHQLSEAMTLSEPCYAVSGSVTVSGSITVEPGVHLVFGQGTTLYMENGGSLTAVGTAEKPIIFEGKDHTPGFWEGLNFQTNSSKNQLSYVTVADAGTKGGDSAAVVVSIGARLGIDHTTVRNAEGVGLTVLQRGILGKFEQNRFEATGTPLRVKAADLVMIDPATTFANNKKNYVLVYFNECEVEDEAIWRALAVPYHFGCSARIGSHVTVEPGVKFEFEENDGLDVTENGSLTAEGTAEKPIVFTGADQTPGYWRGIYFESKSAKNVIRNVSITYAGQSSQITGGVCVGVSANANVSASEIAYSADAGIRLLQHATINQDAETSNHLHDNKANVKRED